MGSSAWKDSCWRPTAPCSGWRAASASPSAPIRATPPWSSWRSTWRRLNRPEPTLARPRLGEDAEQRGVGARLAGRDRAVDSLTCESLVPRRRPSLAVEIAGEIDKEPIPPLSGERLQLSARDGIELKDSRGGLTPGGAGGERHGNSEQQEPPAPDHTLLHD